MRLLGRLMHDGMVVWLACSLLAGCTTMKPVARADFTQLAATIKPGDHVRCTLHNGGEIAFTVTQVEPGALIGKKHRVEVADIARLEVRRFSTGKTLWLVAALVAAGVMAAGVSELGGLAAMPAAAP